MHDHPHNEEHFKSPDVVRDIVIGMADGLTVPFALAAGLSGAVDNNHIIITAGVAEIVAGSIAMGLGGYLSAKTESEHYHSELKREYWEVDKLPHKEKEEVREVLEQYGISRDTSNKVADEMALDKDKWVDFMMKFELGLEKPDDKRAGKSAANISLSYIVGGFIPLTAYMFTSHPHDGLIYSSVITLLALFVFGFFKSKATGQPPVYGALRTTIIGALAAAAAFGIASLIKA